MIKRQMFGRANFDPHEADSALYDRYLEDDEEMRRLSAADSERATDDRLRQTSTTQP
ncbi:hypothetical protein ACIHCX_34030 [Streptomyces sp. NPDC052043]|uniref:hypothetical protein n=1 Tax=Streptomyces sp. NPDC052043 TaxID=3365684 RepID=UPI0037D91864